MSTRSTFPEGIEVHQRHLANTETQRSAYDKQILTDASTRGVASGLVVTVGGTTTRISIALGSAYAPNGEFMTLAAPQTNVALADDTLGVVNYVILMYDEVESQPESHETDGTTRNALATVSPRLVVLTAAQHAALPVDNAVLTTNDQNRGAIIAKVTANGPAVALTDGSIENASPFPNSLNSTQPVNITGITVISVDTDTDVGTGTLSFNFGTTALTWSAPGDVAGAPVVLTVSQTEVLTSSNGQTMLVRVAFASIPSSNKTDSIVISNIYTQSVIRFSAIDDQHRSLIGTGVPTTVNPHGMTLEDLSPGTVGSIEDHQDVQHHNGLARFNNANTLLMSVVPAVGVDALQIPDFTAGDYAYINGKKITEIADATDNTWGAPEGTEASTWGVYLDQDAVITKIMRTAFLGTTALNDKLQIVNMSEGLTGPFDIEWTDAGLISAGGGPTKTAPVDDAILRLDVGDSFNYVDVFVKGSSTPGVTESDPVTVAAGPNMEEHILLGYVCWDGTTGTLGYGDPGGGGPPNLVYDLRSFGTLGTDEMSDSAGYTPPADLGYYGFGDGVLTQTEGHEFSAVNRKSAETAAAVDFVLGSLAFPSIEMAGGTAIVGGKVFKKDLHTFTVQASNTNRMYLDSRGDYQVSTNTWDAIAGQEDGRPVIRLAEIVIDGASAEVSRTDRRIFNSAKHSVSGGVVGLDSDRRASWGTTTTLSGGSALTVSGVGVGTAGITVGGTGHAITAFSNSAASNGIFATTAGAGSAIKGQSLLSGIGVEGTGGLSVASVGVKGTGTGSSAGVYGVGGPTGNGIGGFFTSSATNGNGVWAEGTGLASGIVGNGGITAVVAAVVGQAHASNPVGLGVSGQGTGIGNGAIFNSGNGAIGDGVHASAFSTNGIGVKGVGTGTQPGIRGEGSGPGGTFLGGAAKQGISATGGAGAKGAIIAAGAGAVGASITGDAGAEITGTTNSGAIIEGGASGWGLEVTSNSATLPAIITASDGGCETAIEADGWIDMDSGTTPSGHAAGGKNVLTKANICKAWGIIGFVRGTAAPYLLEGYNVTGAGTPGSNQITATFDTDIGMPYISGTTVAEVAVSASVLQVTVSGGLFTTSDYQNSYMTITTGPNVGYWRIATWLNVNQVELDVGAGATTTGPNPFTVEPNYSIVMDLDDQSFVGGVALRWPRPLVKREDGFDFVLKDSAGATEVLDATVGMYRITFHIFGHQY